MSFHPRSTIPTSGWAYYFDYVDNSIFRQKVCGVSLGFVDASPDDPEKRSYVSAARFVVAYNDGVVESDVDLENESDFLLFSANDDFLSGHRLRTLAIVWTKRNDKEPHTSPAKIGGDE